MFGVSGSDSSVPGSPLPSVEDVDGKNVSFSPVSWPSVEPHQWVLCHCVLYWPLPLHTAVGSVSLCRLLAIAFGFAHRSGFCVSVSSTCHYLVHIAVFFVVTVPSTVSSSYQPVCTEK